MKVILCAWLYLVASFLLMLAVKVWARSTGRACRPLAAWFDIWVGFYWDAAKRRLYVFPVPMLGIVVDFGPDVLVQRVFYTRGYVEFQYRGRVVARTQGDGPGCMLEVIRALRAAFPGMYLKEAKDLWDNRKAA